MQTIIFFTLIISIFLFIWGKIRYDLVALAALFVVAVFRIIPADKIFSGFGHPAVITVAAVMIISKGLQNSGLIDFIARRMTKLGNNIILQTLALCSITAIASAFMNNVGALAIMMPVAIQLARKNDTSPSYLLMPLAFSSLLGGMMTMIGTPPNIIIATFRTDAGKTPFGMFDFMAVGLPVTVIGIIFISLIGRKLLPNRKATSSGEDLFRIDDYITELKVVKDAKFTGKTISEIREMKDYDLGILGLVRNKKRIHIPDPEEELQFNDILILEADPENLKTFIDVSGFELLGGKKFRKDAIGSKDIVIREVIVMSESKLIGRTAAGINLRSRYGINLLAVARSNVRIRERLDRIKFRVGDVLLMQGRSHLIDDTVANIGCLPLAERGLRVGYSSRIIFAVSVFTAAILATLTGLLSAPVAFSMTAFLYVITNIIPFRDVYKDIDWSVIVLLAAMIPVGIALEVSGGADSVARLILSLGTDLPVSVILMIIMLLTMLLSNVINNAATAVLMAPIAIITANNLGLSADPFLMTVAVGASSPFLTPIGHQSNTLVMAPGGYKFSDYWKMGLPLQLLILIVSIPFILAVWL